MSSPLSTKSKTILKISLILLALIGLAVLFRTLNLSQYLESVLNWIKGLGPIGPVVFVLIYIVAAVFLVSGAALTLGGGAIYGVLYGTILVSIASTFAAGTAFLIGRFLAREWVSKKIAGNEKFKAVDEAVGREGAKIVFLTRLSPLFPYTFLNYALSLTKVSFKGFLLASWIGMIPGTIMYVYLGSAASTALAGTGGGQTLGQKVLFGVGLVATIAVTVYVTRIAKKALNEKVGEGSSRQ